MRIRATIQHVDGKVCASCLDLEAAGEGATREEALAALREAVSERLSPEAVAPPPHPQTPVIEIIVVDCEEPDHARKPTGPGDAGT